MSAPAAQPPSRPAWLRNCHELEDAPYNLIQLGAEAARELALVPDTGSAIAAKMDEMIVTLLEEGRALRVGDFLLQLEVDVRAPIQIAVAPDGSAYLAPMTRGRKTLHWNGLGSLFDTMERNATVNAWRRSILIAKQDNIAKTNSLKQAFRRRRPHGFKRQPLAASPEEFERRVVQRTCDNMPTGGAGSGVHSDGCQCCIDSDTE